MMLSKASVYPKKGLYFFVELDDSEGNKALFGKNCSLTRFAKFSYLFLKRVAILFCWSVKPRRSDNFYLI